VVSLLSFLYHLVPFLSFFVRAPSPPETPLLFRLLGLGNRRHCPPPAITAVVCRLPVAEGTKPCVQLGPPNNLFVAPPLRRNQ
uniref:Secreted protein n=1 Tax=Aegilops tauschii subsp. strangulata TaxID=200361 RepID=A0A453HT61_AEGTS